MANWSFILTSLVMSAIILIVMLCNKLFPKFLPAKLRYTVWLVLLVGLIIPLRPVIGNGLITITMPAAEQTQPEELPEAAEAMPETDSTQDVTGAETSNGDTAGWSVSPAMVCVLVWGGVAAMIFAYHIWRYIRFIRMIRRWGVPVKDENVLSVFRAVQTEKGLDNKKIDLKVCSFVSSSMLTGFLHTVILLPEKHFEEDELELIFRHELIHYKRRDLIVKLLSVIALSLNWFNPIVYLMCAAIQTDGEASCDEAVLQDTGIENRQFYAEVIIGMIGGKNTTGTLLSTCFYGGKSSIKRRLDSIMDTTRKKNRIAVVSVALIAIVTLFSGSVLAFTNTTSDATASEITAQDAEKIAVAAVGGGTVTKCEAEYENGRKVYDISITYGNNKHEMDVDVITGTITNYEVETINQSNNSASSSPASSPSSTPSASPSSSPSSSEITAERAKEIALAEVGGGTVTECKLDYENGREVYEIKIVYGNTKYEMDVDTITGAISDYSTETADGSSDSTTDDHDDNHDSDDDHDD